MILSIFHQSIRDLQYGIQMTVAFVCCILFAFSSGFGDTLQIKWILPILATLVSISHDIAQFG